MNHQAEEKIETHVAAFVANLHGRFREHCSDEMLVGVLMQRLCREPYRDSTRAQALLDGDRDVAYDAACPIFELILEYRCRAGGNGHHVAQSFCAHMDSLANAADEQRRGKDSA